MRRSHLQWLLIGLALGGAAALLITPVRRRIVDTAGEAARKGKSALGRSREARELAHDLVNLADRAKALARPL